MTPAITSEMTVNQVLQNYPSTLPVFNRYRVDACCGGVARLAGAAAAAGVAVRDVETHRTTLEVVFVRLVGGRAGPAPAAPAEEAR